MNRPARLLVFTTQCAIILGSLAFLALKPPAAGVILLIPLGESSGGNIVNRVVAHGGALLGAGPIGRSLIVYGRRDAIGAALKGADVLLLAAPFTACGSLPNTTEKA